MWEGRAWGNYDTATAKSWGPCSNLDGAPKPKIQKTVDKGIDTWRLAPLGYQKTCAELSVLSPHRTQCKP
jgi:hypothetical protein